MSELIDPRHVINSNHRRTKITLVGLSESAIRVSRARLFFVCLVSALCFCTLGGRLIYLALSGEVDQPRIVKARIATGSSSQRAPIVDRNGVLLASNLVTASLYADARAIRKPKRTARRIVEVLPDLKLKAVAAKLASNRPFVWLKRNLSPREQQKINDFGIPGLSFETEERRIYPLGALASHVVGFTDIDNLGIAGVEQYFDAELKQRARSGAPLQLSLDIRVQHALRDELARAVGKFSALGAAGVVLDVNSGELLAMTSLPDFDSNHPLSTPKDNLFNRATKGVYELGSVFKIITVAMALDTGTVSLTGGYDASRPIKISRFTIHDFHAKNRWLSVPEIFMYSSNIGAAKMAVDVGGVRQQAFMSRLGLLSRSHLELPELGDPMLPPRWGEISTMTIAYGHGIAVSPLHLAAAMGAVVNGGVLLPSTLLKRDPELPARGDRVLSAETSEAMRDLLRMVVEKGTGRKAGVSGYLVGGKTGTADKPGRGGYRRRALITSFASAFPMNKPRYAIYVLLDEPKGLKETHGFATAGWNAAPLTGRIIARIAPILGVKPIDTGDGEGRNISKVAHSG